MPTNTNYTWEPHPFLKSYQCKSKGCARDKYKNGLERLMKPLRVTPDRADYVSLIYMCDHCKRIAVPAWRQR